MKIRALIVTVITMIILTFVLPAAYAQDNVISFSGTTETVPHGLAKVNVNAAGDQLANVSGVINYAATELTVFSITPNSSLSDWQITFQNEEAGKIVFSASSSGSKISAEQNLFTITFVAVNDKSQGTNVTATSVVTKITERKQVVTNQKEIDEAKYNKENAISEDVANSITIPDPIYEERDVQTDVPLAVASYDLKIEKKSNGNAYLKSAKFTDGNISPSFNKLTNSYKVTIDDKVSELQTEMVAEYPTSTVDVSPETNNQVVVTVTSENGTVNSYVFSIQRAHNYTPVEEGPSAVISPSETVGTTMILLIIMAAVSLGIIGIGGYYVYLGSHGQ
ncbi:MAG: hypothetical protein IJI05_06085 [Erysipelotrichaceae bacterium]|nr:hypothetical protein [Erysipelotrichaceae bacterium]